MAHDFGTCAVESEGSGVENNSSVASRLQKSRETGGVVGTKFSFSVVILLDSSNSQTNKR